MSDAVGDQFEVETLRPAAGGAVGRLDDGRVIFVRHALAGELVRVRVSEEHRSYLRGDAETVLRASEHRVEAPCAYAHVGGCGGCDLQHADEFAQLAWKSAVVRDQLRRLGGIERDVVVEAVASGLGGGRTRIRCAVDHTGHLAMRRQGSNDLVAINACYVGDPRFSEALTADWDGATEVELRAIGDDEPFAVVTLADGTVVTSDLDGLIDDEPRRSHAIVAGHRFRIGPTSFWQAHREAPNTLLSAVTSLARAQRGQRVVDLYAGVGLFTVPLATVVGRDGSVIAVEAGSSAAADARRNVADLPQVSIIAKRVTARLVRDVVRPGDIVVLDPPRAGAGAEVAAALASARPRRVIYVSCDAATLARDLRVMIDAGYDLRELRAFDLFPMSEHVELVAVLDEVANREQSAK